MGASPPATVRPWSPGRARAALGTVRVRATVAAVLIVAVALAAGAAALVVTMRRALADEVRHAARLRAADVAAVLESGLPPAALELPGGEDQLVQVVDGNGDVVAASGNVLGEPAVARLRAGGSSEVDVPIDDDRFLAVAAGADTRQGPVVVVVARTLEAVDESTQVVTRLLAAGLPALLLVAGAATWRAVGRALRPVDAMRAEVEEISAARLDRRVPQPATGDEIARLASTMNRMLDRLEQAHARQRRFIADAAHELRSPVAAIRQLAEVALAHPQGRDAAALAAPVLGESLRVQRLVEDLLLLARADEHALGLERGPVDLDDLVFEEARRLRTTGGLRVDTTRVSAGRVDGDEAALRRVVRNLAENAARHARELVAFSLRSADGAVVLAVDDDGPGIPAPDRGRVLQRFVRLDDARSRDGGGAGLGLAIVAELAAAHGGTVAVGDSPWGGTRLTVTLPATPD